MLRNKFDGKMRDVVDMEFSAATHWRHNSMIIPGMHQTEQYMRADDQRSWMGVAEAQLQ